LVAHTARVILAAADPLERWLATYSEDGLLIVWNLASGKELRRITVPKDAYEMKFAPQGSSLALISNSAGVQFWDVLAGTWQTSPEIPLSTMQTVAFSSDGSLLAAAANEEPVIYVLDIRNLSQNPSPPPSSIGARGKELRFGTQRDGTQNRLRDGQGDGQQNGRLRRLRADQLFFRLCFSPDGKQLFAGGCTSDIQVWSIPSGQEQARLLGHRGPVRDLAISPDGKTLASMGADRSIRLWHVATGQELLTLAQDERPHWLTFANTTSIVVAVELDTPWHRGLAIFDSDGSLPTGPN
jgi:WD40 repeat protein